jgi:hypothetical protein
MDNQNKICSVDDCDREVFTELSQNKCVLHCEKPRDKNRHGESYHLLGEKWVKSGFMMIVPIYAKVSYKLTTEKPFHQSPCPSDCCNFGGDFIGVFSAWDFIVFDGFGYFSR